MARRMAYFSGRGLNDKIGLGIVGVGGEEIALGEVEAVRVLLWSRRAHSALAVNQDDLHAGTSKTGDLRFPGAEIERLPLPLPCGPSEAPSRR